jgi:hypothetical protein
MIGFLLKVLNRLIYGYRLKYGYRISQLNRDEQVLWNDEVRIRIVTELMANGDRVIYKNSIKYIHGNKEEVPKAEKQKAIEALKLHFEDSGKVSVQ